MGGDLRPGIVHRLDKMTSGLVVVAKNDVAHRHLSEQFKSREVRKTYVAMVHGRVAADSGEITRSVGRDPWRRTRMKAGGIAPREALTKYRVLRRFGHFTLVEAKPKPGARIKSACIWPAWAILWWATPLMERPPCFDSGRVRNPPWPAHFCTRQGWLSHTPLLAHRCSLKRLCRKSSRRFSLTWKAARSNLQR
jgi:hypothetical protein